MSIDQQRRILARQLRPLAVRQYAESRKWTPVEGVRGRFWLFRHPEQQLRQLQIPMDADDSYVLKIICPLHAVSRDLELADPIPFTRKVTTHLMRATADLVDSIEHSRVEAYLETHAERPMLSWNLCDALLRMQPEQNAGQLELSTTWAADPRLPPPLETDTPSRVTIKTEYIPEIQRAAQFLRPSPASNREEMLIGTVEILSGVVGADGRRSGEVQFSLLLPDSDPLRVRANLDPEQYADAVRAHESGRGYVRLHGVLHRGQRIGRIDPLRALQLLDEQAANLPTDTP